MSILYTDPAPEALREYPVIIRLPIQWGDQDLFGHVNNTVYFRWYESARIAYLERLDMADKASRQRIGPILAAIGCNYRRQLRYPDAVLVGSRVSRIGRTSMVMEHAVWSTAQSAIAADGQSTIVAFDYETNQTQPVPQQMREMIASLEGNDEFRMTS